MGKYKGLFANTGLFVLNSVATKLVSFVLVPFYTAYLTAAEYGLTDMSVTVIGLVGPLATLCVAGAAMRFVVADGERSDQYAAVSAAVTFASIAFVALISPLLDLGVFGGLGDYKALFVAAYGVSVVVDLCGNIACGLGRVKLIPLYSGISALVTLAVAWIAIGVCGMGVAGYYCSVIAGPAVALALYATAGGFARLAVEGARAIVSGGDVGERVKELCAPMLRYALPLIPNALFWWMQTSLSRLFITGMLGISASGMYAAASKIPGFINTSYSIFQQAWQLSSFQESESESLSGFFGTVFRALQSVLTILCALLSFFSPWVASVFLLGETANAWPLIPILLLANLMNVFGVFYGTIYTTTMNTPHLLRTTTVGAAACVVFTPMLIPFLGLWGACIASVASQALVFAMRARDSKRFISFDVGWRYLIPVLALLSVQSVVTSLQVANWQAISVACLFLVVAIQGARVAPVARKAIAKAKGAVKRRGNQ